MITSFTREELYKRHQLSHQQIDDILGERFSGDFPESKAQHLGKLNTFFTVSRLFEKEGIRFVPQKGPMLSYRLYGDPLYRAYNDLDFLISKEQIPTAVELLIQNGFQSPFYRMPEKECHRQLLLEHVNEIMLYSPALDTGVELHWSLFNGLIVAPGEYAALVAENETEIIFEGHSYSVFNDEPELLYLVIHGGMHGWGKLKWLTDIVVFLQKAPPDDLKFLFLVRQLRAFRLVEVCNELLKVYFPGTRLLPSDSHVKAPGSMVRFAVRQISEGDRNKTLQDFLSFFLNTWRLFPGVRYKLDLLGRSLFATDLANVKWMPCSAAAYYIVSPFWKLRRGFRKAR